MIEGKKFTLGEISFEIDPKSLQVSLESMLKQPTAAWPKMATAAGIPCEPFDQKLVRPVLLGFFQSAWYEAFTGSVPEKCQVNQVARIARYNQQLKELVDNDGKDLVVSRTTKKDGTPKTPKVAVLWKLVEGKYADVKTGQRYIVVKTLLNLAASKPESFGFSALEVFENQAKLEGIKEAGQTNVNFHLQKFKGEGIVVQVNADGTARTDNETPAPKSAATTAKATTPATPSPKAKAVPAAEVKKNKK